MNDQRDKEIRKGGKVVALIGSGAQMVGTVADIFRTSVVIAFTNMTLPVIPGQPPPILALPDDTETRKPRGERRDSCKDDANHVLHLGDDVCCMMNHGIQVVCVVTEFDPGSAGGGIVTGMRRGGTAVTQMRSGLITMAGEFVLPFIDGRAPCLLLEREEQQAGAPRELLQ